MSQPKVEVEVQREAAHLAIVKFTLPDGQIVDCMIDYYQAEFKRPRWRISGFEVSTDHGGPLKQLFGCELDTNIASM